MSCTDAGADSPPGDDGAAESGALPCSAWRWSIDPSPTTSTPGLTTVRFPLEQIGEAAANIALSHDEARVEHVVGEIVRRESA